MKTEAMNNKLMTRTGTGPLRNKRGKKWLQKNALPLPLFKFFSWLQYNIMFNQFQELRHENGHFRAVFK